MNTREYVVLHHTADPKQGPQFDKVNASHKARGFPISSLGFYVGYHYFIGFDGTIKVARAEWETGAHCAAMMMNTRAIGICLAGDFTQQAVNDVQAQSLAMLLKDIKARNLIENDKILLHREVKPTACPGRDLRAIALKKMDMITVEDLRYRLEEYETMYAKATAIGEQNRLSRIIDRLKKRLGLVG